MASITASMQTLSLDEASTTTPPADPQDTAVQGEPQPQPRKKEMPRRASRPDQVDPRPLPSLEEWREVKAARPGTMYYGIYADDYTLQKMLIRRFPKQLGRRDPTNDALLYPALLYLRNHFKRPDISVHIAFLPQRAKDLNPEIQDEIGDEVVIVGLFELEEEAYLDRMTQKEVDELAELLGKKPTWWRIAQSMPSV